jgi:hypothetical protein
VGLASSYDGEKWYAYRILVGKTATSMKDILKTALSMTNILIHIFYK